MAGAIYQLPVLDLVSGDFVQHSSNSAPAKKQVVELMKI